MVVPYQSTDSRLCDAAPNVDPEGCECTQFTTIAASHSTLTKRKHAALCAFQAASKFRGQSAVFTWLYGILLNVNRKRSRNIFRLIFTDRVPEREAEAPVGPASSADAATTAVLVSEALQQLSVKHREVIVLHYLENMPVDDIARQLQVGSGTVKSRLHYARKHLGSLLPEELNHFA